MEDDLWQKMIFDGRQPLTEDDFWWKTKTPFGVGRRSLEDNLQRKKNLYGRQPLMEDDFL